MPLSSRKVLFRSLARKQKTLLKYKPKSFSTFSPVSLAVATKSLFDKSTKKQLGSYYKWIGNKLKF